MQTEHSQKHGCEQHYPAEGKSYTQSQDTRLPELRTVSKRLVDLANEEKRREFEERGSNHNIDLYIPPDPNDPYSLAALYQDYGKPSKGVLWPINPMTLSKDAQELFFIIDAGGGEPAFQRYAAQEQGWNYDKAIDELRVADFIDESNPEYLRLNEEKYTLR